MAGASADASVDLDFGITQFAQTTLQTVTDTDGAVPTFLQELWNRPDIANMVLAIVGVYPMSSGGSYSTTGRNITPTDPGLPFPAGGLYINIFTPQDLRNFRMQATAGGTVMLVCTAFR